MAEKAAHRSGFGPGFFRFLREIAKNNNREWFTANKGRYETDVCDPSFDFVRAVGPKLGKISPHLIADPKPVGGSVMRIYRDIRFSKDKSPYRTSVGIHFMHDADTKSEEGHFPGFFLHLAPGDSWVFAGLWQPDAVRLEKIRRSIVRNSAQWRKVRDAVRELSGESYKRPPAGYDPNHPFIDDLKRKDFTTGSKVPDSTVTAPRFPDRFVEICRSLDPLNRFLARAIDLPY